MTADGSVQFDERGYAVLHSVQAVPPGALRELEALFERAGENSGHHFRSDPFVRHVEIPLDQTRVFAVLLEEERVLECVCTCLGQHFKLAALHGRSVNPFALALDAPASAPGAPACRVLWLLDDCGTEGTAALRVMPGSHRASPSSGEPVNIAAPAGSAIVLDGKLWTGRAANPCSRHLRMLVCDYRRTDY